MMRPGNSSADAEQVSSSWGEKHEPVYNIEVEGDHCYRVGEQGLLVHNMSAPATAQTALSVGSYRAHVSGESDRIDKNRCNMFLYFQQSNSPILQIASGDRVFAGALSEDIRIWAVNEPKILALENEDLAAYLPQGKLFGEALAVNANVKEVDDHSWIFITAASVLKSGGNLTLVGTKTAGSLKWAVSPEGLERIASLGFVRILPLRSSGGGVHGNSIDAEQRYKALGGSYTEITVLEQVENLEHKTHDKWSFERADESYLSVLRRSNMLCHLDLSGDHFHNIHLNESVVAFRMPDTFGPSLAMLVWGATLYQLNPNTLATLV